MFSDDTPLMSVAAWPPAPMAAMFIFSLGEILRGLGAANTEPAGSSKPPAAAEVV
jgi:hypothetical protein